MIDNKGNRLVLDARPVGLETTDSPCKYGSALSPGQSQPVLFIFTVEKDEPAGDDFSFAANFVKCSGEDTEHFSIGLTNIKE